MSILSALAAMTKKRLEDDERRKELSLEKGRRSLKRLTRKGIEL